MYSVLAVVLYFVFFHRLDSFYMRTWDESIYAVNTFEMMQRGEYIAPYLNGVLDNDKPPMLFWHQMAAVKLFGYNELAMRLPSALYGALSVVLLFLFIKKQSGLWLAFATALVLCCSRGFISFHSARTGEMDTMVAFAVLGLSVSFFCFINLQKKRYLLLYCFFLVFGFYTKLLVIFFIIPVQALYVLFAHRSLLKNVWLWMGLAGSASLIALFLYVRNGYEDHYLQKHFLGLMTRYNKIIIKDHIQPFDFYINNLVNERFAIFILLFIPALLMSFRETNRKLRFFLLLHAFSAIFYLLLISASSSKLYWYDVPLYPLMAVPIGYCIWKLAVFISFHPKRIAIAFACFFLVPVYYAIKRSHNNDISDVAARRCEVIPEYFHDHKGRMPYPSISVADNNFNTPVIFYKYLYTQYKQEIKLTDEARLQPGEVVIAGNDSIKNYISAHYKAQQLETFKNATIYKINA